MVYLDWAATSPPDPQILNEVLRVSGSTFANPSSLHTEGAKAQKELSIYRANCALILQCRPEQLYFTSGGTESNNLVISSLLKRRDRGRIIVSGLEHPSLWEPVQVLKKWDWEVKVVNPEKSGLIKPAKLTKLLNDETKAVITMAVHNETGVIQSMEDLIQAVREQEESNGRPIHFHSDLVQAAGKVPLSLGQWDLDSASFSAHKIRGPRGIGLLYLKRPLQPFYIGGGQENGIRPGTENIAGAAGISLALKASFNSNRQAAEQRMAYLLEELQSINGCLILPETRMENPTTFSPWILSCAFPPLPGEVLARVMSDAGYAISTGSACSSHKKTRTRALESMGIDQKTAFSSIRISQGPTTTRDELKSFIQTLKEQLNIVGRAVHKNR